MVKVRISETYDLSTKVGEMGIFGIHTPDVSQIKTLWEGLMKNYRYYRLTGCDVKMACASMLPADPLQIGTEAGDIAPQDMFNPILYKAVSNDSFETVLGRIYNGSQIQAGGSIDKNTSGMVDSDDDFKLYYGLLADPDGWKKAMPQQGLELRGLYPIMHTVYSVYGNTAYVANTPSFSLNQNSGFSPSQEQDGESVKEMVSRVHITDGGIMKGNAVKMPRLPTYLPDGSNSAEFGNAVQPASFPKTYVACIITPPAKLNQFYFRMKVTWTIEFEEPRPMTEIGSLGWIATRGYATYYDENDPWSPVTTQSSVDADKANIDLIMTSSK